MYCAQNNRIYCSDCNKSYIPNSYSNHLKSKGHNIYVMKKRCCSCDNHVTHSNNHDITCNMKKLSHESSDNMKTVFSNVKIIPKNKQTKAKNIDKYKHIDPDVLLTKFRKLYTGNYCDSEPITEAKAMLRELYRAKWITWGEYIFYLDRYIHIYDKDEN